MKNQLFVIVLILLGTQACNLEDESIPRGDVTTIDSSANLLHSAVSQIAYNHCAVGGRTCSTVMQYLEFGDIKSFQHLEYEHLGSSFFSSMWSSGYYAGSLVQLQEILNFSGSEGNESLRAIALVLIAHEFAILTQYFGDIPFSEAAMGEAQLNPVFDSQEEVLVGIISMLDEAIQLLGSEGIDIELSVYDLLYDGDLSKWRKFASGLKARYLFNSRNQDTTRDDEILSLIDASFSDSSEEASFAFGPDFENPQFKFASWRLGTLQTGSYFLELLDLLQDPRKDLFTYLDDDTWVHFSSDNSFISSWFEQSATIPFLSHSELLFMKAELSFLSGAAASEVSSLLQEAVESSFLANDLDLSETRNIVFISSISDFSGLNQDEIHQRIIEQAYIAYYGNNHQQAWSNFRRTGYPEISSTGREPKDYNPSNSVPVRFSYPESEFIYNSANVEAAAARQDGALLDSQLWMFGQ